jgi:hypothetical protein
MVRYSAKLFGSRGSPNSVFLFPFFFPPIRQAVRRKMEPLLMPSNTPRNPWEDASVGEAIALHEKLLAAFGQKQTPCWSALITSWWAVSFLHF